jgi:hypothetical protein
MILGPLESENSDDSLTDPIRVRGDSGSDSGGGSLLPFVVDPYPRTAS